MSGLTRLAGQACVSAAIAHGHTGAASSRVRARPQGPPSTLGAYGRRRQGRHPPPLGVLLRRRIVGTCPLPSRATRRLLRATPDQLAQVAVPRGRATQAMVTPVLGAAHVLAAPLGRVVDRNAA